VLAGPLGGEIPAPPGSELDGLGGRTPGLDPEAVVEKQLEGVGHDGQIAQAERVDLHLDGFALLAEVVVDDLAQARHPTAVLPLGLVAAGLVLRPRPLAVGRREAQSGQFQAVHGVCELRLRVRIGVGTRERVLDGVGHAAGDRLPFGVPAPLAHLGGLLAVEQAVGDWSGDTRSRESPR